MKKYEVTTKATNYADSAIIRPDGYSSVIILNSGTTTAYINDNIPLLKEKELYIKNDPDCEINEDLRIRFDSVNLGNKIAVLRIYYKSI